MSKKQKFDGEAILALKLGKNDSGQKTVHQYLIELVWTIWQEGESFSGKRPFGNSGWQFDLYKPLVKAKIIVGKLNDDGYIEECDEQAGHAAISAAIEAL